MKFEESKGKYPVWPDWVAKEKIQMRRGWKSGTVRLRTVHGRWVCSVWPPREHHGKTWRETIFNQQLHTMYDEKRAPKSGTNDMGELGNRGQDRREIGESFTKAAMRVASIFFFFPNGVKERHYSMKRKRIWKRK